MPHLRLGHVDDGEARLGDPQAPLEILGVEEELLVEEAGGLDRRARDRHRGAGCAARVGQDAGRIGLAETLVPAAAENRVEAGARRTRAGLNRRRAPCRRARPRRAAPPPQRPARRRGPARRRASLFSSRTQLRAPVERPPDPDVVAAREAEVDARTHELDLGETLRDRGRRAVGRAVVDPRPSRSHAATRAPPVCRHARCTRGRPRRAASRAAREVCDRAGVRLPLEAGVVAFDLSTSRAIPG